MLVFKSIKQLLRGRTDEARANRSHEDQRTRRFVYRRLRGGCAEEVIVEERLRSTDRRREG